MLHAGGKFGGEGYKVSGGLHGVGVSVVNALSEWLELEIFRDGYHWHQRFERGAPVTPLEKVGKLDKKAPTRHDGLVHARPRGLRRGRLRLPRALAAPARDRLPHQGPAHRAHRRARRGRERRLPVRRRHQRLRRRTSTATRTPIHRSIIFFDDETADGQVEVAMQWNTSYNESIFTFANNINTTEGGTHLSGFRGALTRTINDYARQKGLLKEKEENLSRRGRARGPHRARLGQAREPAVRGPDQDQARQHRDPQAGRDDGQRQAGRVPRGAPAPRRGRSSRRPSTRRGPARRRARRATSRAARACSRAPRCPASWPTAPSATRASPSSTSSRATRPAARPSRRATAPSRPSCRCAARSSTSRRRASTRCSPTTRS